MPASIIAFSRGTVSQAGPMVAMTLVFLNFLRGFRAVLAKPLNPGHYNRDRPRNHFSRAAGKSRKI